MSKLLDPDYINGLSEEQFAQVFEKLRSKIQEDPMEYFVKSPLFCNFDPVAGQVVALKLIFDQALDPEAIHDIARQTGEDEFGVPIFEWSEMDEWEIFEHLTGERYHLDKVGKDLKNRITLCLGSGGVDRYLYDAVPQFPVSQGRDSQGQSTLRLLPVSVD